jgi:signal transduction histidine kinase
VGAGRKLSAAWGAGHAAGQAVLLAAPTPTRPGSPLSEDRATDASGRVEPRLRIDRHRIRLSPTRDLALIPAIVGFGLLWALGALLPFWFLDSPQDGAAFFPSSGLALAALVLAPRRTWPLWLGTIAVAELTVDLTHGQTIAMAAGFALANTMEPLVGASGVRHLLRSQPTSLRQRLLCYLVAGVVVGPLVGALIGASTAVIAGDATDWLSTAGRWWLGDALGVLVLATPIVAWARPLPFEPTARRWELVAMVVLATGVTLVPAVLWHHPMLYAVLPVLMWAALRGGTRAVSLAGLGIAFAADWAAVTGRAGELVASDATGEQLVLVQVFLAVSLVAALVLAVEVADRRRVEDAVRTAEALALEAERSALLSAQEERRRIARETHDIVGHALSVMLLQAGAARRLLDDDIDGSRAFLESIETVGRSAFGELDVALALGGEPVDNGADHGLDGVPQLIQLMRLAGMDITLDVRGDVRVIPRIVDRSAFRIVQEALTNVARHSPARQATVEITVEDTVVGLSVVSEDENHDRSPSPTDGRGLTGMRERARAVGGTLEAGPSSAGFVVRARLPRRLTPSPEPGLEPGV